MGKGKLKGELFSCYDENDSDIEISENDIITQNCQFTESLVLR